MSHSLPVAIVTGGARGIGRAITKKLSADGHSVVVNYNRSAEPAEALVEELTEAGGDAVAVQANVGSPEDHHRLLDAAVQRWGRLDVLVNNAGITSPGRNDILETTLEGWDELFRTNLRGPYFLTQQFAKRKLAIGQGDEAKASGTVVNISSISSYALSLNRPDYCIAKAGMGMMTQLFAARLADEQIRVYEICPGVIASDMTAPVKEKYDQLIAEGLSPIRRWGQPEDVAQAVSAVVAGHFPFSTGERINVDGGFHIRRL